MSVVVPHAAIDRISESGDPKQAIIDTIGDLDGIKIVGDLVLLGTYIRPKKTAGGIIRPTQNVEEDLWQGKVGLVLKWGTTAFKDTPDYTFEDEDRIQPGSWAVFFVGDAKSITIRGLPCRLVRDVSLRMVVDDPQIAF